MYTHTHTVTKSIYTYYYTQHTPLIYTGCTKVYILFPPRKYIYFGVFQKYIYFYTSPEPNACPIICPREQHLLPDDEQITAMNSSFNQLKHSEASAVVTEPSE